MAEAAPGPEDAKLLVLARSAAARTGGAGAAVRDDIGRTYLAGTVAVASLRLSALQAAVAQAVGSGVTRLEAVALVGERADGEATAELLAALGHPVVLDDAAGGAT
ncbi:cytidine deaminase [Aquipuribacter sp. SD81]|uniref:cytidine deaminase n=1 Tax=Aquipuribacter sp. SD81 TaxID=3127703 RepID=UPI003017A6F0